jgi:sulfur-oxidizing protein SoxZ
MSAKPRIKVPDVIKTGDVIEIKTLIAHVMETGLRRDQDGKAVPRNIINAFSATFEGKDVFKAALQPGISANPFISFFMKVPGPGELELKWVDDSGATIAEKVKITPTA